MLKLLQWTGQPSPHNKELTGPNVISAEIEETWVKVTCCNVEFSVFNQWLVCLKQCKTFFLFYFIFKLYIIVLFENENKNYCWLSLISEALCNLFISLYPTSHKAWPTNACWKKEWMDNQLPLQSMLLISTLKGAGLYSVQDVTVSLFNFPHRKPFVYDLQMGT